MYTKPVKLSSSVDRWSKCEGWEKKPWECGCDVEAVCSADVKGVQETVVVAVAASIGGCRAAAAATRESSGWVGCKNSTREGREVGSALGDGSGCWARAAGATRECADGAVVWVVSAAGGEGSTPTAANAACICAINGDVPCSGDEGSMCEAAPAEAANCCCCCCSCSKYRCKFCSSDSEDVDGGTMRDPETTLNYITLL